MPQERPPTAKRPVAAGRRAFRSFTRSSTRLAATVLAVALGWGAVPQAVAQSTAEKSPEKTPQSVRFLSAGMLHERLFSDDIHAREAGRHYVLGVLDALAFRRDARVCLGPEVEANELIMVVMRHLAARPDMHRYNAASFVREAIATEFPCV